MYAKQRHNTCLGRGQRRHLPTTSRIKPKEAPLDSLARGTHSARSFFSVLRDRPTLNKAPESGDTQLNGTQDAPPPINRGRRPTMQFTAPPLAGDSEPPAGPSGIATVVEELPPAFQDRSEVQQGAEREAKEPNNKDSYDGLELGILPDLNATLSGTRHSTFECTRSLDGTGTGTGTGISPPPVLDGSLDATFNSTMRAHSNFNDTLGRSERAEMIARDIHDDTVLDELEPPGDLGANGSITTLKAAVRQAEELTETFQRLQKQGHPVSWNPLELPPPHTQAAIARLYRHEPPPPLPMSVGVEALSIRSIRRRFGPSKTLINDRSSNNEDGGDVDDGQASVCSAAPSLFRQRAPTPSDCGSRMAISVVAESRPSSPAGSVSAVSASMPPVYIGTPSPKKSRRNEIRLPPVYRPHDADVSKRNKKEHSELFGGPRLLRRAEGMLLNRAIREREKQLKTYLQRQPEQSRLLCLVRQWCDRTRLGSGAVGDAELDPMVAHQEDMNKALKEEESARSNLLFSKLQAREKLRLQSMEARDGVETRFNLPKAVDILAPHKKMCSKLNPFDLKGDEPGYEFISIAKPPEDDDIFGVLSSGSFSSSSFSSRTCGSTSLIHDGAGSPRPLPESILQQLLNSPAECALTPEENGLLELVLLALVESSSWGDPERPFAPQLPALKFNSEDDLSATASQLSNVYLKSGVRFTDLINVLDLHAGLFKCVGYYSVQPPPPRPAMSSTGSKLLQLDLERSPELGIRGMTESTVDVLPLTLTFTMRRAVEGKERETFQCCGAVDLIDVFRQFPTMAAETLVRFRGGGSSQNPHYRVNIPQWCRAVWKRLMMEVYQAAVTAYLSSMAMVFDPFGQGKAIHDCSLTAFEVDVRRCVDISKWRCSSLKALSDAHWRAAVDSRSEFARKESESIVGGASVTGPPMAGDIPYAPGPRVYYIFDMQNLYITASLASDQSNYFYFPRSEQLREQYHAHLASLLKDLRGGATRSPGDALRGSITDGNFNSRSPNASRTSRRPSLTSVETRIPANNEIVAVDKPRLGLATALKQWSNIQKMLDAEYSFSMCMNSIHTNEVSIINFNAHVNRYNAYRARESLVWGPIYRNGLRLAYALCLYLQVRPFDKMPEKLVAFLHPLAQFSGCAGGYREMKANLKEVKISITERCRRAAVAVEIMTIDDAERLLEAAMNASERCSGNATDIVSCEATEADVLTTSLRPVSLPEKTFADIRSLTFPPGSG